MNRRLWRWRIARWLIHAGLRVAPEGAAKTLIHNSIADAGRIIVAAVAAHQESRPLSKVYDSGIGGATVGCCATESSSAGERTTEEAAQKAVARGEVVLIAGSAPGQGAPYSPP